jgi:hypothetical protein
MGFGARLIIERSYEHLINSNLKVEKIDIFEVKMAF